MENSMKLGGNIELSGFSDLSGGDMVILKKIIGNHVKRMTELTDKFESIKITMKKVHETEASEKYQLNATLIAESQYNSEVTERNLYVAIDNVLKKIIKSIE